MNSVVLLWRSGGVSGGLERTLQDQLWSVDHHHSVWSPLPLQSPCLCQDTPHTQGQDQDQAGFFCASHQEEGTEEEKQVRWKILTLNAKKIRLICDI